MGGQCWYNKCVVDSAGLVLEGQTRFLRKPVIQRHLRWCQCGGGNGGIRSYKSPDRPLPLSIDPGLPKESSGPNPDFSYPLNFPLPGAAKGRCGGETTIWTAQDVGLATQERSATLISPAKTVFAANAQTRFLTKLSTSVSAREIPVPATSLSSAKAAIGGYSQRLARRGPRRDTIRRRRATPSVR